MLDTSSVRLYIDNDERGSAFSRLVDLLPRFAFTFGATAFFEVLSDIIGGDVSWGAWLRARAVLNELVEPELPALPEASQELYSVLRKPPPGSDIAPHRYRAITQSLWRHAVTARSYRLFMRALTGAHSITGIQGRVRLVSEIRLARDHLGGPLLRAVADAYARADKSQRPPTTAEFVRGIHEANLQTMAPEDAEACRAFSHVLGWHCANSVREQGRFSSKLAPNRASDLLQLKGLSLAYLVSDDIKLRRALDESQCDLANRCMTLNAFVEAKLAPA